MSGAKVVLAVFGGFLALIGLALASSGGAMLWYYAMERNDDGFFESSAVDLATDTYALTSEDLDLGAIPTYFPSGWLATVQISAESQNGTPVFVGIGPSDDVSAYLGDVAYSQVTWNTFDGSDPAYQNNDGVAPAAQPSEQDFWMDSSEGDGTQSVSWDLERGEWSVVIMNADATSNVEVDATAGAKTQWFLVAAWGLLLVGLVIAGLAVLMLILAFKSETPPPSVPAAADSSVPTAPTV